MRIAYLNPCAQMGGAETSLLALLASVRAAEPQWPLLLILGEDGPLVAKARNLGVEVVVAPLPPSVASLGDSGMRRMQTLRQLLKAAGGVARYRRQLSKLLRSFQPDVIHTTGFKMHVLGASIGGKKAPVVWHIHDYVRRRSLASHLLRWMGPRCAAAIVNSHSVGEDVQALLPGLKVVPIYNCLDLSRFTPEGDTLDLDALSNLRAAAPGTIRVGLVATFAKWKGHLVFLEALARISTDVTVRGYIIGGPIYRTNGSQWSSDELQAEAERLGILPKIGFTGFLDDTAAAMRSLDIVVHASTEAEPFGMVLVEGMACGRAVVGSRSGGAAEIIEDGDNALAHSPGQTDALALQLRRLAENSELRARLGRAGQETAKKLCDPRRLAMELFSVYRSAAGDRAVGDLRLETLPGVRPQ
jgi:glycosyltransferase involved in cell wall biosynthesis